MSTIVSRLPLNLTSVPPTAMKTMTNTDLFHCILEPSAEKDLVYIDTSDVPVNYDAVISDGGALIQSLTLEPSCSNFGDYSSVVCAARVRHELECIPNKLYKEKLFDFLTNEATEPGRRNDRDQITKKVIQG